METMRNGNWPIANILNDLAIQGDLSGVTIKDTHDLKPDEYRVGITPSGNIFVMCWNPGKYLRLIMNQNDEALVEAFFKVLEYRLLCRYKDEKGQVNVEWEKEDMQRRILFLRGSENVFDLEVLR